MIFHRMEPFGGDTKYLGAATTSSVIANVNRKKGTKAYESSDFMPSFEEKKAQTDGDMLAFARAMTAASGGEDKT